MEWFLEKDGNAVRIPESVLIYKIENCEISPDTLIVNSEIKTWTPLKNTTLYTEYKKEFTPPNIPSNQPSHIDGTSKNTRKAEPGTLVIYGYTGWFLAKPTVKIYLNGEYLGDVSYKARTKEITIIEPSDVELRCNIRSTRVRVYPNTHTELFIEFDRSSGKITTDIRSYSL